MSFLAKKTTGSATGVSQGSGQQGGFQPPPPPLGSGDLGRDSSTSMVDSFIIEKEALKEALRVHPGDMTEVSVRMVEIAHQISINAQKALAMTKDFPAGVGERVSCVSEIF